MKAIENGIWFVSSGTIVVNQDDRIISTCIPFASTPEVCVPLKEAIENATLISKAPELFRCLKKANDAIKRFRENPLVIADPEFLRFTSKLLEDVDTLFGDIPGGNE